jgi:hypothetical protein
MTMVARGDDIGITATTVKLLGTDHEISNLAPVWSPPAQMLLFPRRWSSVPIPILVWHYRYPTAGSGTDVAPWVALVLADWSRWQVTCSVLTTEVSDVELAADCVKWLPVLSLHPPRCILVCPGHDSLSVAGVSGYLREVISSIHFLLL